MKIVINILENIAGIEIYPIISMLLFFIFFILVTWLTLRTNESEIEEMSRLPLDQDNDLPSKPHSN
ncbi:MAG: CcoQ/FixQ family Cbb3-type cytochrome c oxidase assembly chaperone [Bacteroidetes bacterium CG18_big_fil_WC_8_21_14_2_50_41_14]|nr:MAG: CcoQ/FixQ family Cbb3-type cytochrome c oxidase assembly chaperone [Bacteroidetes bacterium CG18_big_fil_WC_8_21_14_2_50_41_14]PJB56674.1 MAG: CcoQ/FixQ family Cbb3-type cytochrome c oxidase assembly chaperone [Bacteroidetes bacterium CG_4_9_14_3_um_filter_41_19]